MPWDQDKYIAALRRAAEAHIGQTITGTEHPYVVHPAQVAMEVMAALTVETVSDPDLAVVCALLHDVIEDTATSFAEIEGEFGRAVASGVSALSKDPALTKTAAMKDSLMRICKEPQEVWMVKLADRISNLMPPPAHWTAARCAEYRDEARLILDALAPASVLLTSRLADKIESYAQYC